MTMETVIDIMSNIQLKNKGGESSRDIKLESCTSNYILHPWKMEPLFNSLPSKRPVDGLYLSPTFDTSIMSRSLNLPTKRSQFSDQRNRRM